MTVDELFLFTLHDLESRLDLRRGEYDGLMSAGLLRKLLLNGRRSLVSQVTDPRGVVVKYSVWSEQPGRSIQLWTGDGLFPTPECADLAALDAKEFLAWPLVVAFGETATVKDVIDYLANFQGAVHPSTPRKPTTVALERYNAMRRFGPDWQCSGVVFSLTEAIKVVLAGLAESREQVERETWPTGYPEDMRGLEGQGILRAKDGTILAVDQGGRRVWNSIPPLQR